MMNRKMVVGLTTALVMLVATVVYAGRGGMGMGGCNENVSIESFKQFQKDTGALRDEMMVKRIELQREQAKTTPDQAKVASLKQELTGLRTQIHEAGKKYGMFTNCDAAADCFSDAGCGMMGDGGCGKGCGTGCGKGCDKQCGADCSKGCGKQCGTECCKDCSKAGCNKKAAGKQPKKAAGCSSCNKKGK